MGFFSNPFKAIAAAANPVALLGTGLAVGGDLFSAYQQSKNVRDTNAMNQSNARESMSFSAEQADRQMAFQERMAGTAHQRQVADLKAAGLNPLLSANSGADSPGGASGSGASSTGVAPESVMGRVITGAMDKMRLFSEYKTMQANTKKIGAEGDLASMELAYAKKNPEAYFTSKLGVGDVYSARAMKALIDTFRGFGADMPVGPKAKPDWYKEPDSKLNFWERRQKQKLSK